MRNGFHTQTCVENLSQAAATTVCTKKHSSQTPRSKKIVLDKTASSANQGVYTLFLTYWSIGQGGLLAEDAVLSKKIFLVLRAQQRFFFVETVIAAAYDKFSTQVWVWKPFFMEKISTENRFFRFLEGMEHFFFHHLHDKKLLKSPNLRGNIVPQKKKFFFFFRTFLVVRPLEKGGSNTGAGYLDRFSWPYKRTISRERGTKGSGIRLVKTVGISLWIVSFSNLTSSVELKVNQKIFFFLFIDLQRRLWWLPKDLFLWVSLPIVET